MIDKIKNYVIGFLLLLSVGLFVYVDIQANADEAQQLALRNRVADLSQIVQEDSSTFSRLIREAEDNNEVKQFLEDENSRLKTQVDRLNNIIAATSIIVKPESVIVSSKNLAVGDSIKQTVDTTKTPERIKVEFKLGANNPMFFVEGETNTNPPEALLNILQKPFKVVYFVGQLDDGTWQAITDFQTLDDKPLKYNVTSIVGRVNPKPLAEKNDFLSFGFTASDAKLSPGILLKFGRNNVIFNYRLIDKYIIKEGLSWYEKLELGYYFSGF